MFPSYNYMLYSSLHVSNIVYSCRLLIVHRIGQYVRMRRKMAGSRDDRTISAVAICFRQRVSSLSSSSVASVLVGSK